MRFTPHPEWRKSKEMATTKDIRFDPPTDFAFVPGDYVPFKDRALCERLRKLSGEELEAHPNPDFKIKVMMNPHPVLIATLFTRLKAASEAGKKFTMILGNPEPETYIPLSQLINYFQVDCRNVHIFAMDEWADDQGNIAPETYKAGFAALDAQVPGVPDRREAPHAPRSSALPHQQKYRRVLQDDHRDR